MDKIVPNCTSLEAITEGIGKDARELSSSPINIRAARRTLFLCVQDCTPCDLFPADGGQDTAASAMAKDAGALSEDASTDPLADLLCMRERLGQTTTNRDEIAADAFDSTLSELIAMEQAFDRFVEGGLQVELNQQDDETLVLGQCVEESNEASAAEEDDSLHWMGVAVELRMDLLKLQIERELESQRLRRDNANLEMELDAAKVDRERALDRLESKEFRILKQGHVTRTKDHELLAARRELDRVRRAYAGAAARVKALEHELGEELNQGEERCAELTADLLRCANELDEERRERLALEDELMTLSKHQTSFGSVSLFRPVI